MAVNVYAWPPVGAVGSEWTEDAPVSASRSIITGRRYVSATQRKRRLASLNVSALAAGRSGAGYIENLKLLLAGGENLVRLYSYPINWHLDAQMIESLRQSRLVTWTAPGDSDVEWSNGSGDVHWFTGQVITGTAGTSGGWPVLNITGAPPNMLIARPGEFVTLFNPVESVTGTQARVMREARTNGSGAASIRLMSALSGSGRVNIGTSDTGVFEAVQIPRSVQPVGADWQYQWQFREVFSDEVGGFTEVNPW